MDGTGVPVLLTRVASCESLAESLVRTRYTDKRSPALGKSPSSVVGRLWMVDRGTTPPVGVGSHDMYVHE